MKRILPTLYVMFLLSCSEAQLLTPEQQIIVNDIKYDLRGKEGIAVDDWRLDTITISNSIRMRRYSAKVSYDSANVIRHHAVLYLFRLNEPSIHSKHTYSVN